MKDKENKGSAAKKLIVVIVVVILAAAFAIMLFPADDGNNSTTRQAHPFEYRVSENDDLYIVEIVSIFGKDSADYDLTTKYAIYTNQEIVYPAAGAEDITTIENGIIDATRFVSFKDKDKDDLLSAGDQFKVSKDLATDENYLLGLSGDPAVEWYYLKLKTSDGASKLSRSPREPGMEVMAVKLDSSVLPAEESLSFADDSNLVGIPRAVAEKGEGTSPMGVEDESSADGGTSMLTMTGIL
jgi:hypothetical protein